MKTPVPGIAYLPMNCFSGIPHVLADNIDYCHCSGCPPELDDFLLKNPHNLNPGHKDVQLDLTREYSSWWLAFSVQEDPIQDSEGEESWTVLLPSCEHFTLHICQSGYAYWYDCGTTVLGDNQWIADWIWGLLHGRNTCLVVLTCLLHSCIWRGRGL